MFQCIVSMLSEELSKKEVKHDLGLNNLFLVSNCGKIGKLKANVPCFGLLSKYDCVVDLVM